jgi:hypothetical protein
MTPFLPLLDLSASGVSLAFWVTLAAIATGVGGALLLRISRLGRATRLALLAALVALAAGPAVFDNWRWERLQRGGDVGPFAVEKVVERQALECDWGSLAVTGLSDRRLVLDNSGASLLTSEGALHRLPVGLVPAQILAGAELEGRSWWCVRGNDGDDGGLRFALHSFDADGQVLGRSAFRELASDVTGKFVFLSSGDEVRLAVVTVERSLGQMARVSAELLRSDGEVDSAWAVEIAGADEGRSLTIAAAGSGWLAVSVGSDLWLLRHGPGSLELAGRLAVRESGARFAQLAASSTHLAVAIVQPGERTRLHVYAWGAGDLSPLHQTSIPADQEVRELALGSEWLARGGRSDVVVHPLDDRFASGTPLVRARPELFTRPPEYRPSPISAQGELLVSFAGENWFERDLLSVDRVRLR